MPAKNANGRRTDRRIVLTFESPVFPAALTTPAVCEDVAEDVEERSEDSAVVDEKAAGLLDIDVSLEDCLEAEDEAVVGEDVAEDEAVVGEDVADDGRNVEELLELLVLVAVLLGLLEPPYVHPAPNGIEGP